MNDLKSVPSALMSSVRMGSFVFLIYSAMNYEAPFPNTKDLY